MGRTPICTPRSSRALPHYHNLDTLGSTHAPLTQLPMLKARDNTADTFISQHQLCEKVSDTYFLFFSPVVGAGNTKPPRLWASSDCAGKPQCGADTVLQGTARTHVVQGGWGWRPVGAALPFQVPDWRHSEIF